MNTIWFVSADTYVILIVGSSHDTGNFYFIFFVVVVPCNPINCSTPGFLSSISWGLLLLIELMMPSNHLILCCPLLLPSIFPSIRVFSSESAVCIRWPKYWSISFSLNPSNEYSGLISFGIDWLDLLAVQGTLKSLLQHHSGLRWSMANSATV